MRPGSDYDIAMRNLFIQGIGFCAAPGPAALIGAVVALFAPKRPADPQPVPEEPEQVAP